MVQGLAANHFPIENPGLPQSAPFQPALRPPPFYSAPSEWAADLIFDIHPTNEWVSTRQTLRDATASNSTDPLLGYRQIAIPLDEWQHENL